LKHYASPRFWQLYDQLPEDIRTLAQKNYEPLKSDPHIRPCISRSSGGMYWIWIGTHTEYDNLT
jgi:hypothetical protein